MQLRGILKWRIAHLNGTRLSKDQHERFSNGTIRTDCFAQQDEIQVLQDTWSKEKQQQQQSPFQHLLKPKAGGISFVLNAMGEHLHKLLDVTICYPKGIPTFWDYISGKVHDIKVRVRVLPIDPNLIGDYEDPVFKQKFQTWVNQLWLDKDLLLTELKQGERS